LKCRIENAKVTGIHSSVIRENDVDIIAFSAVKSYIWFQFCGQMLSRICRAKDSITKATEFTRDDADQCLAEIVALNGNQSSFKCELVQMHSSAQR